MFVKVVNGVVVQRPYTWDDMRKNDPERLFPSEYVESIFKDHGAVEVKLIDKPEENHLQSVVQEDPEFIDGVLTQVWKIVPATAAEVEARTIEMSSEVRAQRNELLTLSDKTQAQDYNDGSNREAWAAYREELRNITQQSGFPWSIVWPTRPE